MSPDVLVGVVAAGVHILEAPVGRNLLRILEPGAGVGDETDPGNHLVLLHHQMVRVAHSLHPWRPVPELGVDAFRPEVGRLKHMGIRGYDEEIFHSGLQPSAAAKATGGDAFD